MATNEKKPLSHSGYYLLAPFLPQHDYVLVPCPTTQMIYFEQSPECLQNFKFLGILKTPEVNKIPSMKILVHHFFLRLLSIPRPGMIKKVWKLTICLNTFKMKKPMRKGKTQTSPIIEKTLKEESRSKVATKVKIKRKRKVKEKLKTEKMKKLKRNIFSKEMKP